jgi:hypothetical protein
MRKRFLLTLLLTAFLSNSCGDNVFKDLSTKDSAAALYEDAQKLATQQQYDLAYAKLSQISTQYPSYASSDSFKITTAGVQAGQCGLNFINFIQGLSSASGTAVFTILMQAFTGIVVNPQKCVDSQATMATLSTLGNDQLLFLAILGMTKVGTYVHDRADRTATTGDGVVDAGFSACTTTTSSTTLDDNDMKQVVTGFGLILQNIAVVGGSFASSGASGSMTAINAFCASAGISCVITDPTLVNAQTIRVFRRLLDSSAYGVGSCDISGAPLGCCPGLPFP